MNGYCPSKRINMDGDLPIIMDKHGWWSPIMSKYVMWQTEMAKHGPWQSIIDKLCYDGIYTGYSIPIPHEDFINAGINLAQVIKGIYTDQKHGYIHIHYGYWLPSSHSESAGLGWSSTELLPGKNSKSHSGLLRTDGRGSINLQQQEAV